MDICEQLEAARVARKCTTSSTLDWGAKESVSFDAAHRDYEHGIVMKFADDEAFAKYARTYVAPATHEGDLPHYGSKTARVFVMTTPGFYPEDVAKLRETIAALGGLVTPTIVPESAVSSASVPPTVSAKAEPPSAAMVVCKKLEAAAVASDCQPSGSSDTSARFGQPGAAVSGVVSVFDDDKTFSTVSAAMAKDKSKKTATSAKTRTLVMWTSDSAEIEKKIRATVAAL